VSYKRGKGEGKEGEAADEPPPFILFLSGYENEPYRDPVLQKKKRKKKEDRLSRPYVLFFTV